MPLASPRTGPVHILHSIGSLRLLSSGTGIVPRQVIDSLPVNRQRRKERETKERKDRSITGKKYESRDTRSSVRPGLRALRASMTLHRSPNAARYSYQGGVPGLVNPHMSLRVISRLLSGLGRRKTCSLRMANSSSRQEGRWRARVCLHRPGCLVGCARH